jgi:hypothetical protein
MKKELLPFSSVLLAHADTSLSKLGETDVRRLG